MKSRAHLILFVLIFLQSNNTCGQNLFRIPLFECSKINNPFPPKLYSFIHLRSEPDSQGKQTSVWRISMQPQVTLQVNFSAGKSNSTTQKRLDGNHMIDLDATEINKLKYEILATSQIINDSTKAITIDQNFNNSFQDDSVYIFPIFPHGLSKTKNGIFKTKDIYKLYDKLPSINLMGKVIDGTTIKEWPVSFKLFPYNGISLFPDSTKIGNHYVGMEVHAAKAGKFNYEGSSYSIFINRDYYFDAVNSSYRFIIKESLDSLGPLPLRKSSKLNERFNVGHRSFRIDSVSTNYDFVSITAFEDTVVYGYDKNQIIPSFTTTLLSKETFNYDYFRGKVLLINFWGSWCQPCIKELPEFQAIDSMYSNRSDFVLLGVAFEQTENLIPIRRLIDRYNIRWRQSIEYQREKQNKPDYLVNKFNVTFFPTTVMLNREGKVVFIGFGLKDVAEMKTMLRRELER